MNHLQTITQNQPSKVNFAESIRELSTSLNTIAPNNPALSETIQLVNYVLIATVIAGIFVYHYIKNHDGT